MAGSQSRLAKGIGYTQAGISKAKHAEARGRRPSAELAIAIHEFTDGAVPGSDMCPDIWKRPEDVPASRGGES